MRNEKDILQEEGLRKNPFTLPEGYLEKMETAVGESIASPERSMFRTILKPALGLAVAFALVFGMGYGVLALTGTLQRGAQQDESIALFEEGFVSTRIMDFYNEEEDAVAEETIDEEEMMDYLETELSFSDISEIYAQLQ